MQEKTANRAWILSVVSLFPFTRGKINSEAQYGLTCSCFSHWEHLLYHQLFWSFLWACMLRLLFCGVLVPWNNPLPCGVMWGMVPGSAVGLPSVLCWVWPPGRAHQSPAERGRAGLCCLSLSLLISFWWFKLTIGFGIQKALSEGILEDRAWLVCQGEAQAGLCQAAWGKSPCKLGLCMLPCPAGPTSSPRFAWETT